VGRTSVVCVLARAWCWVPGANVGIIDWCWHAARCTSQPRRRHNTRVRGGGWLPPPLRTQRPRTHLCWVHVRVAAVGWARARLVGCHALIEGLVGAAEHQLLILLLPFSAGVMWCDVMRGE
jgi:hypothetical protein